MNRTLKILGLIVGFCLLAGVAHADIIQDQSWAGRNLGSYDPGQTFTADENALLESISLQLMSGSDLTLTIGLYDWNSATDTIGSLIATADTTVMVPEEDFKYWVDFEFSGVSLAAGHEYAVVFTSPAPEDRTEFNIWWYDQGDAYSGGAALWHWTGRE